MWNGITEHTRSAFRKVWKWGPLWAGGVYQALRWQDRFRIVKNAITGVESIWSNVRTDMINLNVNICFGTPEKMYRWCNAFSFESGMFETISVPLWKKNGRSTALNQNILIENKHNWIFCDNCLQELWSFTISNYSKILSMPYASVYQQ